MKKLLLLLMIVGTTICNANAQDFTGNASAAFGILNPKLRLQYEMPLQDRASFGASMNYYFVNWTGPVVEPFIRIYGKKSGNGEGFFSQVKLIYGNLSVLDYDLYEGTLEKSRWSTFGAGINIGYKFLIGNSFTIEPLLGYRFLSLPLYAFESEEAEIYYSGIGEGIGWYLTTGFPVDFQVKFGFQF